MRIRPDGGAYTGQTWEEYQGLGWLSCLHSDERENIVKIWGTSYEAKATYEIERRVRSAAGEYRFFLIRGAPILKNDGEICGWIGTYADIHDYKMTQNQLKEKNSLFKEVMNQLEIEKKILADQIQRNIDKLLLPLFRKLKAKAVAIDEKYWELLETHIKELAGSFGAMGSALNDLTPKETKICGLIRNGLSSKEIAKLLKVSILTVGTHRTNIRKKLKIFSRKINLAAYLQRDKRS